MNATNVAFKGGSSYRYGGQGLAAQSALNLRNVSFQGGKAISGGGGMLHMVSSNMTAIDVRFSRGMAQGPQVNIVTAHGPAAWHAYSMLNVWVLATAASLPLSLCDGWRLLLTGSGRCTERCAL